MKQVMTILEEVDIKELPKRVQQELETSDLTDLKYFRG